MPRQAINFSGNSLTCDVSSVTFPDARMTLKDVRIRLDTDYGQKGPPLPRRSKSRLTDRAIKALPVPTTGARKHRFADVAGLAVQVSAGGTRSGGLVYTSPVTGAERFFTVGQWPAWSAAALLQEVAKLRRMVDVGMDPHEERDRASREIREREEAPTVADLAKRYDAEHVPNKRPRSAAEDRAMIRGYILPALGKLRVADVTKVEIAKVHRAITTAGKPYRANRVHALLRMMLSLSIEWGMRADNPARGGRGGVQMNPEDHRERFLSQAEIARLAVALDAHPEKTTVALLRFLLLTGCRFGEAANATWSQIDLSTGTWTKPSSHVKQKKQHTVPLSAPALALLTELQAVAGSNPLVFASPRTGRPIVAIKTAWKAIRVAADLPGVRIHDLRHSFASALAASGASLQLIGSLLGHSQLATTARYAHLADDARREAVERVGAMVVGGTSQSGEVIELPRRGGASS